MTLKFVFFLIQEYNKILKSSFFCTCLLTSIWYNKYGPEETPSLITSVPRVWVPPRAVLGSTSEELGTVGQKKASKELWMKELLLRAIKAQSCQGVGALWEMLWNKPGIISPECRLTVPFACCHRAHWAGIVLKGDSASTLPNCIWWWGGSSLGAGESPQAEEGDKCRVKKQWVCWKPSASTWWTQRAQGKWAVSSVASATLYFVSILLYLFIHSFNIYGMPFIGEDLF